MRIAVYGGTFNPIHNAHLHLVRGFAQQVGFDRVLLVPSNTPPHKSAEDLAPGEDRLAMCRLAAAREALPIEVSQMELGRPGPSYTADTLRALSAQHPNDTLYLLMGEDMFLTLERWYRPEDIYRAAVLCAAPRSESGMPALREYAARLEKKGARCVLRNLPYLPISSTGVREAVRRGEPIDALVPPAVRDYIYGHGVYAAREGEPHDGGSM